MKLLVLDQFSDLGGAQQNLLELLSAFSARGWRATVGIPGGGALCGVVRKQGFAVEAIDCGPYRSGRKSAADMARFLRGGPRLARQIARLSHGCDLVYINGPRLLPSAALAGLAVPVVFHSHSYLEPGLPRWLAGSSLRRLRASVIANCEFVAKPWRSWAPEVTVIYNGVDGPPAVSLRPGGRTVACIGRIAPEKGQLEFLEAAAAILRVVPDCRFVIYGAPLFSGDRYEAEVRRRAAGLPVEFAGWIDDVQGVLRGVDIVLVPSSPAEATTRVILEAYAAGVPVVAFANGGIPEVVEHGRSGYLAHSIEEMAAFATALLRDGSAVSAGARACWARRFTLERFRAEIVAALERAAQRPAPEPPPPPARGRTRSA